MLLLLKLEHLFGTILFLKGTKPSDPKNGLRTAPRQWLSTLRFVQRARPSLCRPRRNLVLRSDPFDVLKPPCSRNCWMTLFFLQLFYRVAIVGIMKYPTSFPISAAELVEPRHWHSTSSNPNSSIASPLCLKKTQLRCNRHITWKNQRTCWWPHRCDISKNCWESKLWKSMEILIIATTKLNSYPEAAIPKL